MQRRGKKRGPNDRGAPARLQKGQPVIPANFLLHADVPVKLHEVGAAAEQHVLAVVHHLAGARMLVGRCASAEIGAAFKQSHAKTAIGERASSRQTR